MKTIDEIKIKDTAEFSFVYSGDQHNKFMLLSEDKSPVHTDDEFARHAKFKEKIGYGFFIGSVLSRLYGEFLPGGSSICLSQTLKFTHPFYIGEELIERGMVISKSSATKVITISTKIFRAKDCIRVFEGEGLVKIIT